MALHAARRVALQMIFARMFHSDDNASVLEDQPDRDGSMEDQGYIDAAMEGTLANAKAYDEIIQSFSPERALDRIPVLDRAILQLALFELSQKDSLPSVAVNEAVALAKRFGEDSDGRFVNGVLGSYLRSLDA